MKQKRSFDWSTIPNLEIRGKGRWCHARVEMNGRPCMRSLHIQADEAGENAPFVKDALRAYKLQLAQDTFAILKLTRSRSEYSTCRELFDAYEKACAGRRIKHDTVTTALGRFRHVLKTVHGDHFDVDGARTSIVSRQLAQDFEAAKISAVKATAAASAAIGKPWTEETLERRLQSALNSAKSVLQQARQLFARRVIDCAPYRQLVLPDVAPFMQYRVDGGTTVSRFVAPPTEVWKQISAALPALKHASPAQWLAFQLAINCGLRRSSARNARWGWVVERVDGDPEMQIGRAKGNNSTVTIDPELWLEIKAARIDATDFILPGTFETPAARAAALKANPELGVTPGEQTRDEIVGDVVAWLRERGLSVDVARCPFHLLRKIYGDAMRKQHGLDEAQKSLGHSNRRLTDETYSDHRSTKHVRVV